MFGLYRLVYNVLPWTWKGRWMLIETVVYSWLILRNQLKQCMGHRLMYFMIVQHVCGLSSPRLAPIQRLWYVRINLMSVLLLLDEGCLQKWSGHHSGIVKEARWTDCHCGKRYTLRRLSRDAADTISEKSTEPAYSFFSSYSTPWQRKRVESCEAQLYQKITSLTTSPDKRARLSRENTLLHSYLKLSMSELGLMHSLRVELMFVYSQGFNWCGR